MSKKILILTSSPQRDKYIDQLLAEGLRAKGHEVCIEYFGNGRERKRALELKPNVVVIFPVRQPYIRDFVEEMVKFGVGVVVRHVEPGCDYKDFENMDLTWRKKLLCPRVKGTALELLWGEPEASIIKSCFNIEFPILAVGAFVADVYKNRTAKTVGREEFCEKYKFDSNKKILVISSPWGLLDIDSDRLTPNTKAIKSDQEAKDIWAAMVKQLCGALDWNVLLRPHPGLDAKFYQEVAKESGASLDMKTPAVEVLVNCDALVHAGSTMALEMHWLNKPAYQFGDVNSLDLPDGNWWQKRGVSISQVSPFFVDAKKLATGIKKYKPGSNANIKAIEDLEAGRYGPMDGKATERAVELIDKVEGEFKFRWPDAVRNYDQLPIVKRSETIVAPKHCICCDNEFYMLQPDWLKAFLQFCKAQNCPELPTEFQCPYCASRVVAKSSVLENPSAYGLNILQM